MKILDVIIRCLLIVCLGIMIAMIFIQRSFITTSKKTLVTITHANGMLNEYEYILADIWAKEKDCKEQLGVFYKSEVEDTK